MIKSFQIEKFKQFKEIKFEGLNRINLFLGNNNAGKTTILEAIFAFIAGKSLMPILSNVIARRTDSNINGLYDFIERLLGAQYNQDSKPFTFSFSGSLDNGQFHKFEHTLEPYGIFSDFKPTLMGSFGNPQVDSKINQMIPNIQNGNPQIPITSVGKWKIKETVNKKSNVKTVELVFPPINNQLQDNPLILGRFVDILSHRAQQENTKIYSFLKRERVMDEFLAELQKTFPNILDIDSIPYPDGSSSPVSFKIKGSQLLPMYNFGDGVQRWYNILGGMILYNNGIHCIEEVDSTFHPSAQKELAQNLYYYSKKYNNQIFMTSHSIEFVDNLLQAVYENNNTSDEDFIRIITLKNDPVTNEVHTRTMTGREAYESRERFKLELR